MNREQKCVWLMFIAISISLVAGASAVITLYLKVGWPRASAGFAFIAIAAIGGLGPIIFKKDKGKVTFDERDKNIKRLSALAGFAISYLFVGLACMIPFCVLGPQAKISVRWLPLIFGGAALTSFYVYSITLLILYGRTNKGAQNE